MSSLVRVGWGRQRLHFPERGPLGDTFVDPAEVVAVEPASLDVHYRDRSTVYLRSGKSVLVFGTVPEVLRCLTPPADDTRSTAQQRPTA